MPSRFSATYVYVGFIPTSAQVATYADRQETMQSKGIGALWRIAEQI
jgi:hypothetical protein